MQATESIHWRSVAGTVAALLVVAIPVGAMLTGRTRIDSTAVPATVHTIVLPDDEMAIPPGPNCAEFTAYCRLCHSPRLALTHPRFSDEKQWDKTVDKMINTYGAPVPPGEKPAIVAYLKSLEESKR